jgi:hypothetical protein
MKLAEATEPLLRASKRSATSLPELVSASIRYAVSITRLAEQHRQAGARLITKDLGEMKADLRKDRSIARKR